MIIVPDLDTAQATPGAVMIEATTPPKVYFASDVLPGWCTALQAITPDVQGFVQNVKSAMGGIIASNLLARAYPLFYSALQQGMWADVRDLLQDAHKTGTLTDVQYAAFKTLSAQYNIPVAL